MGTEDIDNLWRRLSERCADKITRGITLTEDQTLTDAQMLTEAQLNLIANITSAYKLHLSPEGIDLLGDAEVNALQNLLDTDTCSKEEFMLFLTNLVERKRELKKLNMFEALQVYRDKSDLTSAELDGILGILIEYTDFEEKSEDRNAFGYCTNDDQSYSGTNTRPPSEIDLNDTTSKISCSKCNFRQFERDVTVHRFNFFATNNSANDDTSKIDDDLLSKLGISKTQQDLAIHSKRLQLIQHVLNDLVSKSTTASTPKEPDAQKLFAHFMGELVSKIYPDQYRVESVVGMSPIEVDLKNGKKLSGKSDLAVIKSEVMEEIEESEYSVKQQYFLHCDFIIEMKAKGELQYTGHKHKSQVISESLVRMLSLNSQGEGDIEEKEEKPNLLFSVLSDCLGLYILIHFGNSQNAYLSHREILPGRIVPLLVWLLSLDKEGNLDEETFKNMDLINVGKTFEEEIAGKKNKSSQNRAQSKKSNAKNGNPPKINKNKGGKTRKVNEESKKKIHNYNFNDERIEVIDFEAMFIAEQEEEESKDLEMFIAYQNHYRYGDPLPTTERFIELLNEDQSSSEDSQRRERLALVNFH